MNLIFIFKFVSINIEELLQFLQDVITDVPVIILY